MNLTPLVSVLIPVYNGTAFLADAIQSVRNQTCQNFEIIVVDDGSSDGSFALAQQLAATDLRIKVIRQKNGGTQSARNTAMQNSCGEWIALLDQDDVWLPRKLESQLALLASTPRPNLLFTNYVNWDGANDLSARYTRRNQFPEGDVGAELIGSCLFGASSVMLPRHLAETLGGFDPAFHFSGDWDMWLRVAESGVWARGVWEPQMRYRLWPGNESKKILAITAETSDMLEKALTRPQTARRSRLYRRSLQIARSNLELARARRLLDVTPDAVPATVFRAWKHTPFRIRWLFRYLGLLWPVPLGGAYTSTYVHRKLCEKW
jgi:glycosyltransferase involved in cell wall biosynthesis